MLDSGEGKVEHVLHVTVGYRHLNLGLQELRSGDPEDIRTIRQGGNKEGAVLGRLYGLYLLCALHEDNLGVLDGRTAVTVHDLTLHAAGIAVPGAGIHKLRRLGQKAHGRQGCSEGQ